MSDVRLEGRCPEHWGAGKIELHDQARQDEPGESSMYPLHNGLQHQRFPLSELGFTTHPLHLGDVKLDVCQLLPTVWHRG